MPATRQSRRSKRVPLGDRVKGGRTVAVPRDSPLKKDLLEVAALLKPALRVVFVRSRLADDGKEWADEAWTQATDKIEKNGRAWTDQDFVSVTGHQLRSAQAGSRMLLEHNLTSDSVKRAAIAAFKQVFGKRFTWNGRPDRALAIRT